MIKRGCRRSERTEEQELAEGRPDEAGAAHDFGDAHGGIVDDAGELVAGRVVLAPDDEVAEVAAGGGMLRAGGAVVEAQRLAVGPAEAPVDGDARAERGQRGVGGRAELGRVDGLVVDAVFVGRAGGRLDVAA